METSSKNRLKQLAFIFLLLMLRNFNMFFLFQKTWDPTRLLNKTALLTKSVAMKKPMKYKTVTLAILLNVLTFSSKQCLYISL